MTGRSSGTIPSPEAASVPGHDGTHIAIARRPGDGPPIVAIHATGFCKETLYPVLMSAELTGRAWVAIDQRGHGDSAAPDPPYDWWDMARDVVAVLGDEAGPAIAFGHSSGAALCAMAEVLAPGTFAAMVLVEPIVFPPPYRRAEDHPLAAAAARRRSVFSSPEEALAAYRDRGPFVGLVPDALAAYVAHGFRTGPDGISLKCRPEVEADLYATASVHGAWDRLAGVEPPALVVAGESSPTHPQAFAEEQARRLARGSVMIVPGTGHFVPMERPDLIAGVVAAAGSEGFRLDPVDRYHR